MGISTPLYKDRPMEWVGSWILGAAIFLGGAFLALLVFVALFWLVMMAIQAGIWLKERLRRP